MSLLLSVKNKESITQDHYSFYKFEEIGGSIGRHPLNDWVICDNQKFISGKHANIFFKAGVFYITDTSTNGIFLNSTSQPIGKDNSVPIKHGDTLTFGELVVEVVITNEQIIQNSNVPSIESSSNTQFLEDIVGSSGKVQDIDGLDRLIGELNTSSYQTGSTHDEELDPLALLYGNDTSGMPSINKNEYSPTFGSQGNDESPESFLRVPVGKLSGINTERDFINSNYIPDDWDFNDLPDQIESFKSESGSNRLISDNYEESDILSILSPVTNTSQTKNTVNRTLPPETTDVSDSALRKILESAGMDSSEILKQSQSPDLELIGKMLRSSIDGLVIALMGRSQIKSGFRMAMTTITPVETNPLKFSINGEEALRSLLSMRPGYKSPIDSITEGFDDLQAHQLAMMAAFQETIYSLVLQFSPESLSKRFDNIKVNSLKLGGKKAHYWDCYQEYFAEMEKNIKEDFISDLGQIFTEAYEEQIRKI